MALIDSFLLPHLFNLTAHHSPPLSRMPQEGIIMPTNEVIGRTTRAALATDMAVMMASSLIVGVTSSPTSGHWGYVLGIYMDAYGSGFLYVFHSLKDLVPQTFYGSLHYISELQSRPFMVVTTTALTDSPLPQAQGWSSFLSSNDTHLSSDAKWCIENSWLDLLDWLSKNEWLPELGFQCTFEWGLLDQLFAAEPHWALLSYPSILLWRMNPLHWFQAQWWSSFHSSNDTHLSSDAKWCNGKSWLDLLDWLSRNEWLPELGFQCAYDWGLLAQPV